MDNTSTRKCTQISKVTTENIQMQSKFCYLLIFKWILGKYFYLYFWCRRCIYIDLERYLCYFFLQWIKWYPLLIGKKSSCKVVNMWKSNPSSRKAGYGPELCACTYVFCTYLHTCQYNGRPCTNRWLNRPFKCEPGHAFIHVINGKDPGTVFERYCLYWAVLAVVRWWWWWLRYTLDIPQWKF